MDATGHNIPSGPGHLVTHRTPRVRAEGLPRLRVARVIPQAPRQDARTCGDRSSARVTPISTGSSGRCAQTTAAKARRQPLKQRQLVEDRGEVGGGGRSLGDFLGQCHRPLAPVLRRLLQLGDPRSNPPPECGGRVFGLEVRDLSLDAALQVRDLRGRLIEAIGGGRGRLLDLGIGETPAPVLPRLSCRRERISASRSRRLRRQR
jgi:hypothetical protein